MSEWWRCLYNEQFYLDLYQAEDMELAKSEADELTHTLNLTPPLNILDCPCGYGRHVVELASHGLNVTGADLSELQITESRRIAENKVVTANTNFVVADARALPFPDDTFDVVLNLFLSLGYFDVESENQRMLDELVRVLKTGGRIVVDQWNRECEIRMFDTDKQEVTESGARVEKEWRFDALAGRIWWKNTAHFADGRIIEWDHSVRAYTVYDLRMMLERAGARVVALYGDLDGRIWDLDSPRTVIVGEKDRY